MGEAVTVSQTVTEFCFCFVPDLKKMFRRNLLEESMMHVLKQIVQAKPELNCIAALTRNASKQGRGEPGTNDSISNYREFQSNNLDFWSYSAQKE